ncbi:hypothetical protein F9K33_00575 [bacterium]|nr:MAG: hypothetical protein F9K33_00575 [bacterium]
METYKSLEIWTAQTLCDLGILASVISCLLHIGRPYFERILSRFTLRVAADLWWMMYVLLRDGSLFLAVLFGFLNLNLDLMADIKIGLPFIPFGTVALAAALAVKVFHNTEDINKAFRFTTYLVVIGGVFNIVGYVFVMEGPGSEYAVAQTAFWQTLHSWRSNKNPELSVMTFYSSFLMLSVIGVFAVVKAVRLYSKLIKEGSKNVQS